MRWVAYPIPESRLGTHPQLDLADRDLRYVDRDCLRPLTYNKR